MGGVAPDPPAQSHIGHGDHRSRGGYLLMYRNGWQVSKGPLAAYICAAVVLLVIGAVFYREGLSPQKLAGMGLCLAGIFLINLK